MRESCLRREQMSSDPDIIFCLEDPGAVNFIAPLPAQVKQELGLSSTVLACGLAKKLLSNRQIPFIDSKTIQIESLLSNYSPNLVIGGTAENPDNIFLKLVEKAKTLKIPTIAVVDMQVNADRRFRGRSNNPLQFAPDFIMVPDHYTKSVYEKLSFPSTAITVVGYPQFDHLRNLEKQRTRKKETKSQTIVFVSEPKSLLNPALTTKNKNYFFSGTTNSTYRTRIVIEELLRSLKNIQLNANLILRLHPKNDISELEDLSIEFNSISRDENPIDLLWQADLVVGMTSMLLQEAAWLSKRTLTILSEPNEFARLPAIQCGLIKSVKSREELEQALQEFKNDDWPYQDPCQYFEAGSVSKMVSFIEQTMATAPSANERKCQ